MDVKAVPVRLGDKTIGVLELGLADQAKRLLTVPGPGVSEIAYQVGFQSLTQFNRLFRRIVGKSPTGFRRSLLKAECHAGQATSVN
jgi:AraC-like DNA-binding protein